MSEDSINVILVKLQHLDDTLTAIHEEVKRTNGRVTALEMQEAEWKGKEEGKKLQMMVATSVISGGVLALLIAFVTKAI